MGIVALLTTVKLAYGIEHVRTNLVYTVIHLIIIIVFIATRVTPSNSATNSLEKPRPKEQIPTTPPTTTDSTSASTNDFASGHNSLSTSNHSDSTPPPPPTGKPMLSEDYAEIGLGEEEGDYSTPAARNYELDRSQIQLNEIIGHGQFGDVHIGTCKVKQHGQLRSNLNGGNRSEDYSVPTTNQMDESTNSNSGGQDDSITKQNGNTGTISVAVKTCKADADITVSEKFLEEAC